MKHLSHTALFVAISVAILSGVFVINQVNAADDKKAQAAVAKPALTVTTARATQADWPLKLAANGNIAAWQEAVVGAESNGLRLNDVRVNVGDNVKRGQVLATFAPESIQGDLAQQNASVAEAEAALAEAEANAARARTLQETGAMSAQQINQYVTAAKTAQARLNAVKAVRDNGRIRLGYTRVVAPDDGVISARAATVGAVVGTGQELFRLIRKNRLEWRAEVTAAELAKVSPGQAVVVTTPTGATVNGKVRVVAPTVDTATRNALVYVDLVNSAAAKAGMFAKGDFAVGAASALSLPQQAVILRDGFSYVFKLEAGNKVSQLKVQAGRRVGERVEIISGVKAGEEVVATGAAFLAEGDTVRIGAAAAAPATPSAAATQSVAKPVAPAKQ
ncbi:MAG: efflux RND transporter periplasmic adaptor subunit [Casimicrobium sp.]